MDSMKLFWGLVVLMFGGVLLCVNQGWLDSSIWWNIIALWPVILIVIGLKLLVKNERILSLLTFGVFLLAVIFLAMTYNQNNENLFRGWNMMGLRTNNQTYSESLTDIFDPELVKNTDIHVSTGAVSLNILSLPEDAASDTLYRVKTTDMGKMEIKKTVVNDTITLVINESQSGMHFSQPVTNRQLYLYLPKSVLIKLKVDSGASKINFNYTGLNVHDSEISVGASSGDIYLNDKVLRQSLDLNAGASSLVFHVPTTLGVDATLGGGLNNITSDSSLNIEKNGERYLTKDFVNKASQITITGSTGVSSIRFQAE